MSESDEPKDALKLVRAFFQIKEEPIRRRLISIIETAALNQGLEPPVKNKPVLKLIDGSTPAGKGTATASDYALIYISHSNSNLHDGPANGIVRDILTQSRTNNARLGVTGALLFTGDCFCQVLEGNHAAITEVFDRIERDPRHRNISLLSLKPTKHRRFPQWSMAYAGTPAGSNGTLNLDGLFANPLDITSDLLGRALLEMMIEFVRHEESDQH